MCTVHHLMRPNSVRWLAGADVDSPTSHLVSVCETPTMWNEYQDTRTFEPFEGNTELGRGMRGNRVEAIQKPLRHACGPLRKNSVRLPASF